MKRLYLIRHAKSDWSDPSKSDFERGLNKRGKRAIPIMAKALKERGILPDLILSSSARRAKKTAKGLAKALGYEGEIVFDEALYFSEPEEMVEKIRKVDARYESLFLIGHNPEMTELANQLGDSYIDNIPTLGIVAIDLPADRWDKVGREKGKMVSYLFPKMFSQ